jgi:crotonobetainyl-CoA:carnitine CoA-transferase CaiB-like acyl-CoA transferase
MNIPRINRYYSTSLFGPNGGNTLMPSLEDAFENLVVIELSNILAGPTVGMFFAELGSTVIKVENSKSRGDATRNWKLPSEDPDTDISSYFSSVNWGKRSIALDITTAEGLEVVHDLVAEADIVIQSYKPGDETKLGVDYDTLKGVNPKIIVGQVTAYGEGDSRPGLDGIIQAESGFTYLNGEPDGPPTKMPVALVDLLLAHQLKEGLLLALLKRELTGEGSCVQTSLLKCATASLANQAANWLMAGVVPQRIGSEHPNIAPYGTILKTKDGREIVVAPATQGQYESMLSVIELNTLKTDERFTTNQLRVTNRDQLTPYLHDAVTQIDSNDLARKLEDGRVPFGFVNAMNEVFEQPASASLIIEGTLDDGSTIRGMRTVAIDGDVMKLDRPLSPPPHCNADEEFVLREMLGG